MAFIGTVQKRNPLSDLFTALQPMGQMLGQHLATQPQREEEKKHQKEEKEKQMIAFIIKQYQDTDEEGRRAMESEPGWAQFQALMAKHGFSTMMPGGRMITPAEKPLTFEQLKAQTFGGLSAEQKQRVVTGEKLPEPVQPPKTVEGLAAAEIQKFRESGVPEEEWPNWIRIKAGLEPTAYQAGTLENKKRKLILEGEKAGVSKEKTVANIRLIDAKIVSMKTKDELSNQVALWKKEAVDRRAKIAENNSEIKRLQVEGGLENQTKIIGLRTENQQHNHKMDELNYALDKADVESRIKEREEKVLQGWVDLHRKGEALGLKKEHVAAQIERMEAEVDKWQQAGKLAEQADGWRRKATFAGLEIRRLEARIQEELGKGRLANMAELNRLRKVKGERDYTLGLLNAQIDIADLFLEGQLPAGKAKEPKLHYERYDGHTRVFEGPKIVAEYGPPEGYVGKEGEQKNILSELVGKASSATKPTFGEWGTAGLDRYADTLRALIEVDPRLSPEIKALYKSYISKITGSSLAVGLEGEEGVVPLPGSISLEEFTELYRGATEGKTPPSVGVTSRIAEVAEEAARIRAEQGMDAAEKYMRSQGFTLDQIASYIRKIRKK